ncbi:MAG: antitoxin [Candidatus Brocadia sp. WS118]|nr:MAG: antitoxin [Candidatus Brocadia sp. WS118]
MKRKLLGRYIVADPEICHWKPTFIGTRIMVSQVLEQVASGMVWEAIVDEWRGSITKEAIAEAVRLASQAFYKHADDFALELTQL